MHELDSFQKRPNSEVLSRSMSKSLQLSELAASLEIALNKPLRNALNTDFGSSVLIVSSTDLFLKGHATC